MVTKKIELMLQELMVGASLLSMKVAGPELEIFFCGGTSPLGTRFSVDTDAWIEVGPIEGPNKIAINESEFFSKRGDAILGIFNLTGCLVESVSVTSDGVLSIGFGKTVVSIIPNDLSGDPNIDKDSWDIFIEDDNRVKHGFLNYYQGLGFKLHKSQKL